MMELLDTAPHLQMDPAEYARLLGYPRGHAVDGRAVELAQWAQAWYAEHGRPWLYARRCQSLRETSGEIIIDGTAFTSPRLQQILTTAEASGAFVVAVSAGPEAEAHAQRLWLEEKPDEYFFLEVYASAVVEYLTTMAGARLCAWADQNQLAVLPHYSPGYPEWDIVQQPLLLELIARSAAKPFPHAIEALSSGMLRPKKSLLAVFGLTPHIQRVQRLTNLVPCQNCSFARCEFRRAPYKRLQEAAPEVAAAAALLPVDEISDAEPDSPALFQPLTPNAAYATSARALQRWSKERLTLTSHSDGTLEAVFRYDGTTCSNMGRALVFLYHITLGPRAESYPLRTMSCRPAPGDEGHKSMCRYISQRDALMGAIDQEKPLLGQPLNDVVSWTRPATGAGCYCEADSRQHKWALALETLHFALAQKETAAGPAG